MAVSCAGGGNGPVRPGVAAAAERGWRSPLAVCVCARAKMAPDTTLRHLCLMWLPRLSATARRAVATLLLPAPPIPRFPWQEAPPLRCRGTTSMTGGCGGWRRRWWRRRPRPCRCCFTSLRYRWEGEGDDHLQLGEQWEVMDRCEAPGEKHSLSMCQTLEKSMGRLDLGRCFMHISVFAASRRVLGVAKLREYSRYVPTLVAFPCRTLLFSD